ncbi:MAG TPA: DUF488 family protein [Phycisphaerae bacterium]|nr:DUF488 family protein [Phycisphaerae bacterium]
MLNRQRVLLAILREAGGTASHLQVTKWAFLLKQEAPSGGGSAFYQFLPYRFGPYSFCLYQEAASLTRNGLIEDVDARRWRVTELGERVADELKETVRADIRKIIKPFLKKRTNDLVEYVYSRYAWFTVNSELGPRTTRPSASAAVYTAGYEGLHIDGFLNSLMQNGIEQLVDVRNNPVSRRYGFHKSTLARLCEYVGIAYRHFPELGIASRDRRDLNNTLDREKLFALYERGLLPMRQRSIEAVAALVENKPTVLVCMEANHTLCHRSRLSNVVAEQCGLAIHHLETAA